MSVIDALAAALATLAGRGRASTEPIAQWTGVRATTVDGVVADLYVDLALRPVQAGRYAAEETLDEIDRWLRRRVTGSGLADLPVAGDVLEELVGRSIAGFEVVGAVVAESEVSVTPELRRLVSPEPRTGPGAGSPRQA